MKIFVQAKPNSGIEEVKQIDSTRYVVAVKEPPFQGRANEAIIRALAAYFNVPVSNVKIISGQTSRQKIMEIK